MIDQHKVSMLQMKHKTVSGSDIYLSKATFVNIGLNPLNVTKYVPSDVHPHISCILTHTRFLTFLSYYLEPDMTIPTSQKVFL